MTIDAHATTFAGLPVVDFEEDAEVDGDHAWALRVGYEAETPWSELFESFVESPGAEEVRALVVGAWGEVSTGDTPEEVVEVLVGSRDRLPKLEAIFMGDIVMEESEISWIHQTDLSPLLSAYPRLTELRVRGGTGLGLGHLRHGSLRRLVVETGGLGADVVREVAGADLPKLEHLELWLGDSSYGATWTQGDLAPILSGARFPALKTLALRNSEQADAVAEAVARSPLLARLEVLDLSMGKLGDAGAKALLESAAVKRLKRLDVSHNFISAALVEALEDLGIEVDASESEPETAEDDRFVAVAE